MRDYAICQSLALRRVFLLTTNSRERLSLLLEALLWSTVIGWCVYLVWDIGNTWKADGSLNRRSAFEFALLGLLVWWPFIRTRIVYGYWMKGWDDTPDRRFRTVDPESDRRPRQQVLPPVRRSWEE